MESFVLSLVDLVVFVVSFGVSVLIGIYYGFVRKKRQNNPTEYLLGGRRMHVVPVAASLVATQLSGPSLLGMPAEIYAFGTQYWLIFLPAIAMTVVVIKIHLEVLFEQSSFSSFAYVSRRFGWRVKKMMSGIYALSILLFLPVAIYVPALALNQMVGMSIHTSAIVLSILCLFYTLVGGMRAILWTDTLQLALMLTATLTATVLAIYTAGGVERVWEAADRGGRLIFFNMDPSPVVRVSFWTIAVGNPFVLLFHLGLNPTSIQRYISLPKIEDAKICLITMSVGYVLFNVLFLITGLALYASYETCDPLKVGTIRKIDQILPHFIVERGRNIPGLAGIFAAGIFSASLSSMSSCLNTLSGCIYEDFLSTTFGHLSEKHKSLLLKGIVLCVGVVQLGLVFVVDTLGAAVFQLTVSVLSISGGISVGIFTAGMVLPKMNAHGAFSGGLAALLVVGGISVGAQMRLKEQPLPLRSDGCSNITNIATTTPFSEAEDDVAWIFRINYMFYAFVGFILVLAIGYPVSVLTGDGERVKDEKLLAPFLRRKHEQHQEFQYSVVNNANKS
ncbi:sodium-coupled monocarboxylate transporter 2-like [Lutzomyia longipalpis]|uniref:sodium-coupled monocarboxylate transporter 2-like n=1 Tax=Lutzomyia longipalpis TaxID=7200 RepID=UPI0024846D7C|nr:sodium-coupled monocarboxylate transporter 2-like [Lutzomyia longipalpis]